MSKKKDICCTEECNCGCMDGYECTCDERKTLALKIGIGVAVVAAIGSLITYTVLKKKNNK